MRWMPKQNCLESFRARTEKIHEIVHEMLRKPSRVTRHVIRIKDRGRFPLSVVFSIFSVVCDQAWQSEGGWKASLGLVKDREWALFGLFSRKEEGESKSFLCHQSTLINWSSHTKASYTRVGKKGNVGKRKTCRNSQYLAISVFNTSKHESSQ